MIFRRSNRVNNGGPGVVTTVPDLAPSDGTDVDTARHLLEKRIFELFQNQIDSYEEWFANYGSTNPHLARQPTLDRDGLAKAWRYVVTGIEDGVDFSQKGKIANLYGHAGNVSDHLSVDQAVRLGRLQYGWRTSGYLGVNDYWLNRYHTRGEPTLLELQQHAEAAAFEHGDLALALELPIGWPDNVVSEWVRAISDVVWSKIRSNDVAYWDDIEKYYALIATQVPFATDHFEELFALAIGAGKIQRGLAQSSLESQPGLDDHIIESLQSKKFIERATAATWLASRRVDAAIDPLHRAAKKEKHTVAKNAMLQALETFDESIDQHLAPEVILGEALKASKKAFPKAATWLSLASLPELRWADGATVEPEIVRWLAAQAVREKSPSASPIVRRLFDRMQPDAVANFAAAIYSLWVREDTRPMSPEQAKAQAARWTSHIHTTPEELQATYEGLLKEPGGSAIASKGLLALAAAGGDRRLVPLVDGYLRRWYGYRSSQCQALIEMLSWIDDPLAIQLVLSVGNRFRTAGIKKHAILQAELLAERKGWTVGDLKLRTVPTGGFDQSGRIELDYGERTFVAHLADDLTVRLRNAEGKGIKSLPAARQTEDETLVAKTKKLLSTAKKEVKVAAKQQPILLREAMIEQRPIDRDDFYRYVVTHPVLGRLATRLVWATVPGDGQTTLFRPLSDGTLLTASDDEIELSSIDRVRLAHELVDGANEAERWSIHFADYEVVPLFSQFSGAELAEVEKGATSITSMQGHVIDDRSIRGALKRAGFELGPTGDAASVDVVYSSYQGLGLDAVLEVQGLFAMIDEKMVGLRELRFTRPDRHYQPVPLADVPGILIVEVLNDIATITAAGEGFDPNWEKRTGW